MKLPVPDRTYHRSTSSSQGKRGSPSNRCRSPIVSSFIEAAADGQPVWFNALQCKSGQGRSQDPFMGRITQGPLGGPEPKHGQVIAHDLTGQASVADLQQKVEGQMETPRLRNGGP